MDDHRFRPDVATCGVRVPFGVRFGMAVDYVLKMKTTLTKERLEEIKAAFLHLGECCDAVSAYQNEIESLIAHAESTLPDGWVRASERLPEEDRRVLGWIKGANVPVVMQVIDGNWFNNSMYEIEDTVTHWRELPEPPKDL
jgi:uncharacterized protein DUF551